MSNPSKLDVARRYLAAVGEGDIDAAMAAFAPDILQTEHPNRLKPAGDRRGIDALRADFIRGAGLLRRQSYEIRAAVEEGETLALEVYWEGELAVALGTLSPGDTMTAFSAMFFTFADGKIVRQTNYDCLPAPSASG